MVMVQSVQRHQGAHSAFLLLERVRSALINTSCAGWLLFTNHRGDRVVVAFDIACGDCFFCKHGYQSSCDTTNPSKVRRVVLGEQCKLTGMRTQRPGASELLQAAASCQQRPAWMTAQQGHH